MKLYASVPLAICLLMSLDQTTEAAPRVNGYSSVVIADSTTDPYRVGMALRLEAQAIGFNNVHLSLGDVPENELPRTCIAAWGWGATAFGGNVQLRLVDALSGTMIKETTVHRTNWVGVQATITKAVRKLWSQVDYRGYNEDVHQANLAQLFPARPTVDFDVATFRAKEPETLIEGVWTDPDNIYEIAVLPASPETNFEYVGVILGSNNPIWHRGEIKFELKGTAVGGAFVGNYYPANKKRQGTTFTVENDVMLNFSFKAPDGSVTESAFVKTWPSAKDSDDPTAGVATGAVVSGSGVIVERSALVATNWHVVEGAKNIEVLFPRTSKSYKARVAIRDSLNDLAVLEMSGFDPVESGCSSIPYRLSDTSNVELGQQVATIGYPLQDVLGMSPKYSSGVISSKTGLEDDPRCFQISAEIQPGSSGSPLFDGHGNVIGIVVSTLSARYLYSQSNALPQNVNYAIKAEYLRSLLSMLPANDPPRITVQPERFNPDNASRCIVAIRAAK